jgi:hypothetical protein
MDPREPAQILTVLHDAIDQLDSHRLRSEIQRRIITPVLERRFFQTGTGDAQGDLWLFLILQDRNVALAYSDEGYGSLGMRWGLVFLHGDQYGDSGGWYNSLRDLLVDSGYFEAD